MRDEQVTSLSRFFLILAAAAFVLNWIWEMAQMPAYTEMAGLSWLATTRRCTVATIGDVAISLAIYSMGAVAANTVLWGVRPRWNIYAFAALSGAVWAVGVEWWAIATERWSYNGRMPITPMVGIGLWPFLQLTVLVPAAIGIAARLARNRVPSAGINPPQS